MRFSSARVRCLNFDARLGTLPIHRKTDLHTAGITVYGLASCWLRVGFISAIKTCPAVIPYDFSDGFSHKLDHRTACEVTMGVVHPLQAIHIGHG